MSKKQHKSRRLAYILLLINTICWGAALIAVKPSLDIISPTRFLFYRFVIAALLTLPVLWHFRKKSPKLFSQVPIVAAIELLGTTLSLWFVYQGLSLTSAINASLVGTTGPIFIVLVAVLFFREREEKRELVGLITAFLGALILVLIPTFSGSLHSADETQPLAGNLYMVMANIIVAFYYLLAKKHYRELPKIFAASISFWVGTISFGLISWWEARWPHLNQITSMIYTDFQHWEVWLATFYMGIFGSIIGLTAYIKGQDQIEASEASLFTYLQPLVYLPLGVILLGEVFNPLSIVGLVLVVAGVLISENRAKKSS